LLVYATCLMHSVIDMQNSHTYIYIYVYIHTYVNRYLYIYMYICKYIYVYIYICRHIYVQLHTRRQRAMSASHTHSKQTGALLSPCHVGVYTYAHARTHTYTCIYIYISVCTHIFICVYICIYICIVVQATHTHAHTHWNHMRVHMHSLNTQHHTSAPQRTPSFVFAASGYASRSAATTSSPACFSAASYYIVAVCETAQEEAKSDVSTPHRQAGRRTAAPSQIGGEIRTCVYR